MEIVERVLLIFMLLVLCVEEGLSKRFRTFSRGRSYSGGGGGYSSGGSSGSDSSGGVLAIVGGVIGGCLGLSVLICVCCLCYRRARGTDKTQGVILNAPNRTRLSPTNSNQTQGVIMNAPNRTGIPLNLNQSHSGMVISDPPPTYSETEKKIFNVQNEMKRTGLNGSRSNHERLPKMGIRPQSTTVPVSKAHKHTTGKSNAGFSL